MHVRFRPPKPVRMVTLSVVPVLVPSNGLESPTVGMQAPASLMSRVTVSIVARNAWTVSIRRVCVRLKCWVAAIRVLAPANANSAMQIAARSSMRVKPPSMLELRIDGIQRVSLWSIEPCPGHFCGDGFHVGGGTIGHHGAGNGVGGNAIRGGSVRPAGDGLVVQ